MGGLSLDHLFSIQGKVAVVTGGAMGLGFEYAKALLTSGAKVVICDIDTENLEAAVTDLRNYGEVKGYVVNVTSEQEVSQFASQVFENQGSIDILINNAGVVQRKTVEDMDGTEWDRVMDVNVKGTFLCSKYLGQYMKQKQKGKIVNISSIAGRKGMELRLAYCTSKASIEHFTRTLAREWAPYQIQVNAIGPGYIATRMNEDMRNDPVVYKKLVDSIPAGRFGEASDLIGTLLYLVSPASDYVSGQTIFVDGGVISQ
jgi:NAD(P)-dependent dehydrogenase (short-subunit alcohol dehydrogenase family)